MRVNLLRVVLLSAIVLAFFVVSIYPQGKSSEKKLQDKVDKNPDKAPQGKPDKIPDKAPQDKPDLQEPEDEIGVDESLQKSIDTAVESGAKYLLSQVPNILAKKTEDTHHRYDELVLYALIHAGAAHHGEPHKNEDVLKLLKRVLEYDLKFTYNVSLQAMALESLDKKHYQKRLQECAQFLVNTQCENGQWSYNGKENYSIKPTEVEALWPIKRSKDDDVTPKLPKVIMKDKNYGKEKGDNSNTQFTALGLWACLKAKVQVPEETLIAAKEFWEKDQNADGGWGYPYQKSDEKDKEGKSKGTMTAAGIGSLSVYKYWWIWYKEHYKQDKHIQDGINWLTDSLSKEPLFHSKVKKGTPINGYYLYSVERAAVLARVKKFGTTKKFGDYDWYKEGATGLAITQNDDGSWNCGGVGIDKKGDSEIDASKIQGTSWALLFLKKAIKPLKPLDDKQ